MPFKERSTKVLGPRLFDELEVVMNEILRSRQLQEFESNGFTEFNFWLNHQYRLSVATANVYGNWHVFANGQFFGISGYFRFSHRSNVCSLIRDLAKVSFIAAKTAGSDQKDRSASFDIQQNVVGSLGGHSGSQSGGLCRPVPSSQVRNLFGRGHDVSRAFGRLRLRPGDLLDHDAVVALDSAIAIAEGAKPESSAGVCVAERNIFPACHLRAELHLRGVDWAALEAHGAGHRICRRPSACPFIVGLPRASDDSDGRKEESREGTNRRTARNPEA
jgi:hypothetical protein